MANTAVESKKKSGWLDTVERVGNKVPHPVLMFLYLIIGVIVLSHILYLLDVSVTEEIAVPSLIPLPVETVLVARIFEVWTHSEGICRAIGRSLVGVDPSMLRLMCPVAIAAVPYGLLMAGRPGSGRTARVVLTGPGGGAWTQALGLGDVPDEIDALVIADALGFCRLAAQRLSPAELGHHVDGDGEVAAAVLVGAAMFAA